MKSLTSHKVKLMSMLMSVLAVMVLFAPTVNADFVIPEKPVSSTIYDPQDYIKSEDEKTINDLNNQWSNKSSKLQIGVVIVDTIKQESIEEISNKIARHWKIGFDDDNGMLIVIAVKDRKFRIETSDNVSTIITDSISSDIQQLAKSDFRNNDYSSSVLKMVNVTGNIFYESDAEFNTLESSNSSNKKSLIDGFSRFTILIFIMFLSVVVMSVIASASVNNYTASTNHFELDHDSNRNRNRKKYSISDSSSSTSFSSYSSSDLWSSSSSDSWSSSSDSWSSSSDSWSSSSDSWSGGGFDGGGSSDSW